MERGSSNVAASLLAAELKGDPQPSDNLAADRSKAASTNGAADALTGRRRATRTQVQSLLEDQQRFALRDGVASSPTSSSGVLVAADDRMRGGAFARLPDMFGQGALPVTASLAMSATMSTSAVVTTLQDSGLRWGAPHGGIGYDAISAPHVRRSWRLVEATHRAVVPTTKLSHEPLSWSVGQRWVRVDDVAQVDALAHAVRAEPIMQPALAPAEPLPNPPEHADTDRQYAAGLHMCLDSTRSTASLPAFLSAASAAVLPHAEAEEVCERSDAGDGRFSSPVPASGSRLVRPTPSLAFFTFTESEYNAIAPPPPPSARFTYASSCYLVQLWARFGNPVVTVDRWRWSESSGTDDHGEGKEWVPTVEEVCAEYHRVTTGVLQQRRQQLWNLLQSQELRLLGEPSPAPSPTVHATRRGRRGTAAAVGEGSSVVAGGTSTATASRHVHPFVASFDRYALLQHTAPAVPAGKDGERSVPLLPSPPSLQPSSHSSSASIAAAASGDSGGLQSDVPSASRPAESAATAQERLTAQTTPSSWFVHDAEVRRRASLAQLLRQEQQTNVPYQQAANRYLALAAGAAVALQRAVFAFHGRDDEGNLPEAAERKEEVDTVDSTGHATCTEASLHLHRHCPSARLPGHPPRGAFTVQLQPLPSVDPAAWRTAEVTVQKAAAEVLGVVSSATLGARAVSPPWHPSQSAMTVTGRQKRARGANIAQGTSNSKSRGRVAVAKSVAASAATEARKQRSDRDDEAADSEASATFETGSELSEKQGREGSLADEEGEEDVKAEARRGQRQLRPMRSSSPTPPSSRPRRTVGTSAPHAQASHLPVDATYAALQEYITDVLPFRCARLRGVVQAGWFLPTPPALPRTLTDPGEEEDVRAIDAQARGSAGVDDRPTRTSSSSPQSEKAPLTGDAASAAHSFNSTRLTAPILTEGEYQELRKVSMAGVSNRVVSHTDEAVLLSLPPTVPRLHREVEQELERYLYEDTSALMEVNPIAQSLVGAIRVAYTQNKLLQRFAARLEHVLEGLKKVSEECEEEAKALSRMR
ncbi:hypothetical protein LSCM1_04880 [Leishmania martiniquensis]|uniref:Uncharacterized protein n=1 Tax=Leishmania martiniquensis TaxID=1580590 RepID=A0A836HL37_9TRYP|nr:hypothetical protein LSCM1_04880 [Leishmania martiniquensis]